MKADKKLADVVDSIMKKSLKGLVTDAYQIGVEGISKTLSKLKWNIAWPEESSKLSLSL